MNSVEKSLGFLGAKAKLLRDAFAKHQVEYMFIGKMAAIAVGYIGTTQDLDIYPDKAEANRLRILAALKEIGFQMELELKGRVISLEKQILAAVDFVQLLHPFNLDIIFAPDGFEDYAEASKHKIVVNEYPLMSVEGILISKRSAQADVDQGQQPENG